MADANPCPHGHALRKDCPVCTGDDLVAAAFKSLYLAPQPGLVECQRCGALVLPDKAELHFESHDG